MTQHNKQKSISILPVIRSIFRRKNNDAPVVPEGNGRFQFPMIFLHIPKTAGTSFRVSAMQYFGTKSILRDYGRDSKNTSKVIMEHYYLNHDIARLRRIGSKRKFITGHYPATRYKEIFPNSPIVTFLRDPVERVVSEYYHFRKDPGYGKSLKQHYRHKKNQNIQVKSLDGLPLSELDFVGFTESYNASLALFNETFDTQLEAQEMNKGNYKNNNSPMATASELQEIAELNWQDIELYNESKNQYPSNKL